MTEQILENGFMFLLRTQLTANDCVAGRIYRLSSDEVVPFAGLDQALVMMNRWMDEVDPLTDEAALRTFKTGRGARSMGSRVSGCAQHSGAGCAKTAGADGVSRSAEADGVLLSGQGRRGDARRREAFLVRIICRQHNSWQGEVCWKAQRLYFRSTLELMCLIHSALAPGSVKAKSAAGTIVRPVFQGA